MGVLKRLFALFLCFCLAFSLFLYPPIASAYSIIDFITDGVSDWISGFSGNNTGIWNPIDPLLGSFTSASKPSVAGKPATSAQPQNYYTTCTSTTVDNSGNVTNYYRGGDTTNMKIIDSYNHTFNTINNTTNNTTTNNYKANVRLSDFLNNYTTNNITNTWGYTVLGIHLFTI